VCDNDMIMIKGCKNTRAVTGVDVMQNASRCPCCARGAANLIENGCLLSTRHFPAVRTAWRCQAFKTSPLMTKNPTTPAVRAALQCCCAVPTTTCSTRWTARCTTHSASSSGCWRAAAWCRVRRGLPCFLFLLILDILAKSPVENLVEETDAKVSAVEFPSWPWRQAVALQESWPAILLPQQCLCAAWAGRHSRAQQGGRAQRAGERQLGAWEERVASTPVFQL
jgi:hypothetical protein